MFPGASDRRDLGDRGAESADTSTADAGTAGKTADSNSPDYVIVGAPLDASTTFQPGARFGPRRVRHFATTFDDYDGRTGQHFSTLDVVDDGDLHAWDDVAEYLDFLEGMLRDVVWDEAVPLTIGGEHTVSLAGVRATDPELFVCLDAHLDLRNEYDDNPLSHACVTRRILDDEGDGNADIDVEEAIVLGARTGSREEWKRAEASDVTVVAPEDVADFDLADAIADRDVYLSVDVDGADPAFAPGTGTMEPFGLTPREMRDVVRTAAPHAIGFDVVEVNDRDDGQAAALAGKLLREFVYEHASSDG